MLKQISDISDPV